jgi:hypothetical protein
MTVNLAIYVRANARILFCQRVKIESKLVIRLDNR